MTKTKIRKQFTVENCVIQGLGESDCVFKVKCKAQVETRTQEKTMRTAAGAEYTVLKKQYSLIVCQNPQADVTFDSFEKVKQFNALFTFSDGIDEEEYPIINITPYIINLDEDWQFLISDSDGLALRKMYENAKAL